MTATLKPGDPGTYLFAARCPRCGTALVHEVSSRPMDSGYRSTAVAKCPKDRCWRRWQIVTELVAFKDDAVPLPRPEGDPE